MARIEPDGDGLGETGLLIVTETGDDVMAARSAALGRGGIRTATAVGVDEALRALSRTRPDALLVSGGPALDPVRSAARRGGIPRIEACDASEVIDRGSSPRLDSADDLAWRSASEDELVARVARLRGRRQPGRAPFDARFLAVVIHDLRNPLNVIGLSLRMIDQTLPKGDPEIEEDFRFINENLAQIERMLMQLSDYCRLVDESAEISVEKFDPRRLVAETVEDRPGRSQGAGPPLVAIDESAAVEAELDPGRARMAILHAFNNASAAAGDTPVRVVLKGGPDRVRIELAVDRPPPSSVTASTLKPERFERMTGIAAERRGLDLAIAARISEMFGGSARLEVEPGRGTVVVLDWPARISLEAS